MFKEIDNEKINKMVAFLDYTFSLQELASLVLMLQNVITVRQAEEGDEWVRFMEDRGLG